MNEKSRALHNLCHRAESSQAVSSAFKTLFGQDHTLENTLNIVSTLRQLLTATWSPKIVQNSFYCIKLLLGSGDFFSILLIDFYLTPVLINFSQKRIKQMHQSSVSDLSNPSCLKSSSEEIHSDFATELVFVIARIRPALNFTSTELPNPSVSSVAVSSFKQTPQLKYFMQIQVELLRATYLKSLGRFYRRSAQSLQPLIDALELQVTSREWSGLDMRTLACSRDGFISSTFICFIQDELNQLDVKFASKRFYLSLLTDMVKHGDLEVILLFNNCTFINDITVEFSRSRQEGGQDIYPNIKVPPLIKQEFYLEFMRNLQIWATCIPISTENQISQPMRCYNYLKDDVKAKFAPNLILNQYVREMEKKMVEFTDRNNLLVEALSNEEEEGKSSQDDIELSKPDHHTGDTQKVASFGTTQMDSYRSPILNDSVISDKRNDTQKGQQYFDDISSVRRQDGKSSRGSDRNSTIPKNENEYFANDLIHAINTKKNDDTRLRLHSQSTLSNKDLGSLETSSMENLARNQSYLRKNTPSHDDFAKSEKKSKLSSINMGSRQVLAGREDPNSEKIRSPYKDNKSSVPKKVLSILKEPTSPITPGKQINKLQNQKTQSKQLITLMNSQTSFGSYDNLPSKNSLFISTELTEQINREAMNRLRSKVGTTKSENHLPQLKSAQSSNSDKSNLVAIKTHFIRKSFLQDKFVLHRCASLQVGCVTSLSSPDTITLKCYFKVYNEVLKEISLAFQHDAGLEFSTEQDAIAGLRANQQYSRTYTIRRLSTEFLLPSVSLNFLGSVISYPISISLLKFYRLSGLENSVDSDQFSTVPIAATKKFKLTSKFKNGKLSELLPLTFEPNTKTFNYQAQSKWGAFKLRINVDDERGNARICIFEKQSNKAGSGNLAGNLYQFTSMNALLPSHESKNLLPTNTSLPKAEAVSSPHMLSTFGLRSPARTEKDLVLTANSGGTVKEAEFLLNTLVHILMTREKVAK